MLLKSAIASGWHRRQTLLLIILTIALSVALLISVEKVRSEVREHFNRSVSATDLIVGARGGALQLMLYSIFHIGQASNNIRWESYQKIASHRHVEWALPILLGDSHKGFRVVGTTGDFFQHYKVGQQRALSFFAGSVYDDLFEAVVGAEVARELGYQIGDQITLSHGMGNNSFAEHDDRPFIIKGVLAATGTPVDRSVYISPEAIEAIHIGWQSGTRIPGQHFSEDDVRAKDLQPKTLTAILVGVKSRLAIFHLQRQINQYNEEPLQAVLPGVALQQLWELIRIAEDALRIVSACVVVAGLAGMLSVLLTSLGIRRREMAILRAVGARPWHLVALLVMESFIVTLLGTLLGIVVSIGGLWFFQPVLEANLGLFLDPWSLSIETLYILGAVLLAGAMTGLWPGISAYRMAHADGLSVRY